MTLSPCPNDCGYVVNNTDQFCRHCGWNLSSSHAVDVAALIEQSGSAFFPDEKTLTLTPEEYDLVWELLLATVVSMERGHLNAHRGIVGEGPKDDALTEDLKTKVRAIVTKMCKHVGREGDSPPIVLELEK